MIKWYCAEIELNQKCVYVRGYLMLMDHGEGGMYVFYYLSTTINIVSGKRNDKRAGVQAKPGSVTAPNWGKIQLNHLKA